MRALGERGAGVDVAREAAFHRLLGSEARLAILLALRQGPLPVKEIARRAGRSGSSISQHLWKLRLSGFVAVRPQDQLRLYRLTEIGRGVRLDQAPRDGSFVP